MNNNFSIINNNINHCIILSYKSKINKKDGITVHKLYKQNLSTIIHAYSQGREKRFFCNVLFHKDSLPIVLH